ncbi:hypothetical protein IHE44_0012342 [Lamprotornis superbus]|uniref:Thioredoxin reductase 1, cytoplasmic n=1 Tax=Lamprotornis superbus TaxID=245042 RepID=A0A835TY83_9PASS|nr:hypothetical protein IHE44_0012342 [Lamprotornis superbus]
MSPEVTQQTVKSSEASVPGQTLVWGAPKLQEGQHKAVAETSQPVVPVREKEIGDHERTLKAHKEEDNPQKMEVNGLMPGPDSYDYDLIVIGGGSGGLAAAKEATKYGKKVMVLDFVTPTPQGSSWGLGGTCVNVGCIPKKLMHQAALLGQALQDSRKFGWQFTEEVKHNWMTMTESVQNYIGSLNWGYRVALRDSKVTYENAYGEFVGPHTIKATNKKGIEKLYTAERFIIATGERPRYLGVPGDKEYCISSDDLFSLPYCPGKTLVVGASYVALECAGFLAGLGLDVTVMVLLAIGRDPCTRKIGLNKVGVNINEKTGKIPVNDEEQTNVPYIYAIGDILQDKLELTPVAIQAGRLLVRRLYAGAAAKCDYVNVPTTVFTPLEYGACGYSEETAVEKFGEENIEVYHSHFWPLEWTVPSRDNNKCYAKIICNIQDNVFTTLSVTKRSGENTTNKELLNSEKSPPSSEHRQVGRRRPHVLQVGKPHPPLANQHSDFTLAAPDKGSDSYPVLPYRHSGSTPKLTLLACLITAENCPHYLTMGDFGISVVMPDIVRNMPITTCSSPELGASDLLFAQQFRFQEKPSGGRH